MCQALEPKYGTFQVVLMEALPEIHSGIIKVDRGGLHLVIPGL